MSTPEDHRDLRELLGAYALGDLPPEFVAALRAHLDGCAPCRAELAEIAPLAAELRTVDLSVVDEPASPPGDLGERILARIGQERDVLRARDRRAARRAAVQRSSRRILVAAAAVALLGTGLGAGTLLGSARAPAPVALPSPTPSASRPPLEQVAVQTSAGVQADTADVIAHGWGVEARFVASGFTAGRVYRAAFRTADGRLLAAGEFLGTGSKALQCNMQSSLPRVQAAAFVVMDDTGTAVLTAAL